MKSIVYITGTRADFGLMESTLKKIDANPSLSLSVLVTGMHLASKFGNTVSEVVASGLNVCGEVRVQVEPETGPIMIAAMASYLRSFSDHFQSQRPDLLLLLGDRGEMLAAAIAALHLGIKVAHIHGGERSGTIDESIRHCISKISHLHFVATSESKARLVSMGEDPNWIVISGAPGLDGIHDSASLSFDQLTTRLGVVEGAKICVLSYHPVVQQQSSSAEQINEIISALLEFEDLHVIAIAPNSDAGSAEIRAALEAAIGPNFHLYNNLSRVEFLSLLKHATLLLGNSSAGVIEAASFGIPVVNVGTRQRLRQRNENVFDVDCDKSQIANAIDWAVLQEKLSHDNIYGSGNAGNLITNYLVNVELDKIPLEKVMTY